MKTENQFGYRQIVVATILIFLSSSSLFAAKIGDIKDKKERSLVPQLENRGRWVLRPAVNFGYNKLLSGYEGYDDLGNVGLDLFLRKVSSSEFKGWVDNLIFRLSLDYFPLQVPKGLNGIEENLYSLNLSVLYEIHNLGKLHLSWPWFLGGGISRYKDEIILESSASGKVSASQSFNGYVLSTGLTIPPFKYFPFKLIPELRYHRYKRIKDNASHMTYQLGVVLWPRERN